MKKIVLFGVMSVVFLGFVGCIYVDEGDWFDFEEIV